MNFLIVLTDDCNLKCHYCYEKKKERTVMDSITTKKVIDFIKLNIENENKKKKGIVKHNITFHGGEPLLNFKGMKKILESINYEKYNVNYFMTTNGTIYTKEISDFIHLNKIKLSVSIDGTKKSHDKNRVFKNEEGTYDTVISNLKKNVAENGGIRCRMTFTQENIGELYKGVKELYAIGVKLFSISENIYELYWDENCKKTLLEQIKQMKKFKENKKDLKISILEIDNYFKTEKSDCFGGVTSFTINTNGDIYPCIFNLNNYRYKIGNIDDSIKKLNANAFKIHYELNREKTICDKCGLKSFCTGNKCKLLNMQITGSVENKNPMVCELTKIKWQLYKENS